MALNEQCNSLLLTASDIKEVKSPLSEGHMLMHQFMHHLFVMNFKLTDNDLQICVA